MTIEIAIGIAGLFIAWLTLHKTFYAPPTEEKETLLATFLATQKLSRELSHTMNQYATKYNSLDTDLFKGITYRSYIAALKESQEANLSDELFNKIKDMKLTKSAIASMQKSLDAQFEDLQKMKNTFSMAIKG